MSLVNWAKSQRAVPRGCARGWFEIDIAKRREGLSRRSRTGCSVLFFVATRKQWKKNVVDPRMRDNIWCVKSDPSWMDEYFIFLWADVESQLLLSVDSAAINSVELSRWKSIDSIRILNIIRAVKSDPWSWIGWSLNISSFVDLVYRAITVPGGFESNVANNPRK